MAPFGDFGILSTRPINGIRLTVRQISIVFEVIHGRDIACCTGLARN